jgi:hypothetical protein
MLMNSCPPENWSSGAAAHTAVRPLADNLLAKNESWLVLTSVAAALGNIGPEAKDALPALNQTLESRRVPPRDRS